MDIRKIGPIKDGEEILGNHTRVKVVKNKVAPPFRKAEFDIMYGEGISLSGEIVDLGVECNVIKKSGSWFSYGENKLGQGRETVKQLIMDNPELAEELKQRAHKLEKIKADALALAAALEGVSLTIGAKTSSTGTIFGSVNNIQIAEALEKLGHIVDRKQIVIKDTVKEVGNYKAIVKLHKEVSVEIPFEVVAE